jgi:hypothetical protein
MKRNELLRLARIGATARIETLQNEIEGLLRRFPGLRAARSSRRGGLSAALAGDAKPGRKRRMSAEGKKAISEAAKKRWAKFREQKAKLASRK